MNQESGPHDRDHAEMVVLYALQALPPAERPVAQARLAGCAECRRELETLAPVLGSLASWPTDVLRPAAPLWDRLAQRIGVEPAVTAATPPQPEWPQPKAVWKDVAPGISCKLLATDPDTRRVSMLVRLAPNTDYPPHEHAGVEELHLLDGVLMVDERTLHPGDYLRSEPGTGDARVWSETGCTCVLMTSYDDVLM
jgi:anti-sigma factor ChrR (cupin superfamily)